jgi:hypothetical protein
VENPDLIASADDRRDLRQPNVVALLGGA